MLIKTKASFNSEYHSIKFNFGITHYAVQKFPCHVRVRSEQSYTRCVVLIKTITSYYISRTIAVTEMKLNCRQKHLACTVCSSLVRRHTSRAYKILPIWLQQCPVNFNSRSINQLGHLTVVLRRCNT